MSTRETEKKKKDENVARSQEPCHKNEGNHWSLARIGLLAVRVRVPGRALAVYTCGAATRVGRRVGKRRRGTDKIWIQIDPPDPIPGP